MTLPNTIQDTYTAGQEWLKRRLELDELTLPDYERPLAPDNLKYVHKNRAPWFKYMLP